MLTSTLKSACPLGASRGMPIRTLLSRLSLALLLALATLTSTSQSVRAEIKPAVVYDLGGKFDKSFNEGVWNGVKRFTDETGIPVLEFEVTNAAQREQALRRMVSRGADIVLGVGFGQADALAKVAADNPDINFAIIDVFWLDGENIRQYAFKEHEGSYLVGIAAAHASKTNRVGFVGGMDIALIRKFACGYVGGVKSVKPNAVVYQNMAGTTPAAWNDPAKGKELTLSQIDRGADVVYHAAGNTGLGVIRAAADAGKFAIGVDSNQNGIVPGSVLTSMLKRVDVAAYETFIDAKNGDFSSGVRYLGIAENGVDWALDENNADLIDARTKSAIEKARADIVSGRLAVHNYETDQNCPY